MPKGISLLGQNAVQNTHTLYLNYITKVNALLRCHANNGYANGSNFYAVMLVARYLSCLLPITILHILYARRWLLSAVIMVRC